MTSDNPAVVADKARSPEHGGPVVKVSALFWFKRDRACITCDPAAKNPLTPDFSSDYMAVQT